MREIPMSGYNRVSRIKEPRVRKKRQVEQLDKFNYLKNRLNVQAAGHRRRLTEVKTQNEKRLNSIRRILDEASNQPSFTGDSLLPTTQLARKTRISEPVTPAPEKAIPQQGQNLSTSISPYDPSLNTTISCDWEHEHLIPKLEEEGESKDPTDEHRSNSTLSTQRPPVEFLANSATTIVTNELMNSNPPQSENNPNKLAIDINPNRMQATAKLAKKAGHLVITVLKHYYADNGYCIDQPKNRELYSRIDQLDEAKLAAEEHVGSLRETIEDLRIEIKGLTNERKDTKRRHEEQLSLYQKKYVSQIKAHRERIMDLERQLEKSSGSSNLKKSTENEDEAKPCVPEHRSNTNSTQFDQVITALFSLDRGGDNIDDGVWGAEKDQDDDVLKPASKSKHQRTEEIDNPEERVRQLQDHVRELEIELESWRANVEEIKEQYTMEKSRRLNVMWSLDAKSRHVKNLLSVEEKHSQLIVKYNQVMMANVMLQNQLEGKAERSFDNGTPTKDILERLDQTRESKYALLKNSNTEILRLRRILKRAIDRHPDLKDVVECPVDDFVSPSVNRRVSPFAVGNTPISSGNERHTRSQTIGVKVADPISGRGYNARGKTQRSYKQSDGYSVPVRNFRSLGEEEAKLKYDKPYSAYRKMEDTRYRGQESAQG